MNRSLLSLGFAVLLMCVSSAKAADASRPNILVILADDMGYSDIGPFGGEIATPNLDRLAKEGMRLTQFYNTARCCPTRACLLSGLYPHQAGVGHMVDNKGIPAYQGYLNDSCVTIAEAIKPAGYHPLTVGKWHVGEAKGHWPVDRGFEHSYSLISGGTNYFKLDKGRVFAEDDKSIDPTGGPTYYLTDDLTDHAVQYLQSYAGKPEPFFLYLAYTAPHWPLHARPEDIAKYKGRYDKGWDVLREERRKKQIELGILDEKTPLTPRDSKTQAWADLPAEKKEMFARKMEVYAAQVDRLDQSIGRVLAKLQETGADKNTLVLFMSDNGGCAEEVNRSADPAAPVGSRDSFLSYGLPWANASNTPFRLYKHWVHEGGISSPFIAWWPGKVKPGSMSAEPSHLVDLMPTFVELSGATYPKEFKGKPIKPAEGRSLVPVLTGQKPAGERAIFWEHEGNRAVRKGDWKLVARFPDKWELYNIAADRAELHDLATEKPEIVKELKTLYEDWAKRAGVEPWGQLNKKAGQKKGSE